MKRIVISIALIATVACASSYLYVLGRSGRGSDRALSAFREGDYHACERLLSDSEPLTFPLALYNSYLATVRGHFTESDFFLQTILQRQPVSQSQELLVQAYLTEAINAYFSHRDLEISPLIDQAKHLANDTSVLMFFEGLDHYLNRHYHEAIRYWSAYSGQIEWMDSVVEKCFPSTWRQLHIAHCMCEEGDLISSREILEKQSHLLERDPHSYRQLATLFLGLTYLKEAQEVPVSQRESYYKLARFYFERSGREIRFERERERAAEHIACESSSLLTTLNQPELNDWGLSFVHTLEEWGARQQIEDIAVNLAQSILLRRDEAYLTVCKRICEDFAGKQFHSLVINQLLASLQEGIQRKEGDTLCYLWHILENLSENPQAMKREVSRLISNELFEIIHADSENLIDTRHFLAFWKQLGPDSKEQEHVGQQLLNYGQLFWKNEGSEEKGTRLLRLAAEFCIDKQICQTRIESFLCELYNQAENSNMIHRLSLIHDALDYFHVTIKEIGDAEKLANHLADAEYLFEARNFAAAKTHASWVLKLESDNLRAERLVGLCCFHLGEYSKALTHLQKLPLMDESVHKAVAFSRVYEAQNKTEHLVQIDNIDSFDENE